MTEYGTTARAHVEGLLVRIEQAIGEVFPAIRKGTRLRPVERDRLGRELAGVIGTCETLRIWLQAGAPSDDLTKRRPVDPALTGT